MGNMFTQRIYQCSQCGRTPDDGEDMWWMGSETWCKDCVEEEAFFSTACNFLKELNTKEKE